MRSVLLIGGFLPALCFGLDGFFSRVATRAGIGLGPFLAVSGAGILAAGLAWTAASGDRTITARAAGAALAKGLVWALGSGLVAHALARGGASLAQLAPLYNTNALVTAGLALVVYAEWRQVSLPHILAGALLIVGGATLVARA
jgi:glucose uptake protein GlcU